MRQMHVLLILIMLLSMTFAAPPSAMLGMVESNDMSTESVPLLRDAVTSDIAYQKVRVAVYAEWDTSLPAYAPGGTYTDNYDNVFNLLQANGYDVTELSTGQITAGHLTTADYDVLVLVDNLPRPEVIDDMMNFWLGGGSILTFNSAIGFLLYSGMLDESWAGSINLYPYYVPGLWAYMECGNATVKQRHPVTADFAMDQDLTDITGNLTIVNFSELPDVLGDKITPLLYNRSVYTIGLAFAYDNPDLGGKIVHLPGNCAFIPTSLRKLTFAALDWLHPRPKARILFDLTHEPYYGVDSWDDSAAIGERFFEWRNLLVNHSYTFDKLDLGATGCLTPNRLAKYDVLIINTPTLNLTPTEFVNVRQWVDQGGGLYLMGEWNSSIFTFSNAVINQIAEPFGLSLFMETSYVNITPTGDSSHPIHEDATSLAVEGGSYVNVSAPGFPLYYDGPNVYMAGSAYGDGKVIFVGDVNLLDYSHISDGDNAQHALTSINWLSTARAEVLVYVDTANHDPNNNTYTGPVGQALCDLGVGFRVHHKMAFFNLSLAEKIWDMVIVDNINSNIASYFDDLLSYVKAGGKIILSSWLYSSPLGAPLFNYLGYGYGLASYTTPVDVYVWDGSHPIFNYPNHHDAPKYHAQTDFGYAVECSYLNVFANGTAIAGFVGTQSTDNASIILGAGGRAISNAMTLSFYLDDLDNSTYADGVELWEAEIAFLFFDRATLSDQTDIQYEWNTTGHHAQWTYVSTIPAYYEIRLGSSVIETGKVVSSTISLNLDGYEPGNYLYQITVYDTALYPVTDHFTLTVSESNPPQVSSPEDIIYVAGTTGHQLTWIVDDDFPDTYNLYRDGSLSESNIWLPGPLIINVDGLDPGVHRFVLEVFDSSGNSANDTVLVTVITRGVDPLMLVAVGAGVGVVAIVVIIFLMKKRGTSPE
ncbi:MAG: hypothetical protein ACP6KW_04960 [Candidatus Thorarchaeota archaeon]